MCGGGGSTSPGTSSSAPPGCYCLSTLRSAIDSKGVISGTQSVLDTDGDMCKDWAESYLLAQALTFVVALGVILVNTLLEKSMLALTWFERRRSRSEHMSAAAVKIFISQFINTALIAVIVNGRLPNDNKFPLQGVGMFEVGGVGG